MREGSSRAHSYPNLLPSVIAVLLYRLIVRWETSTTTRADLANRLFVPGGRKQAGRGRGREREAAAAPASVPARGDPLHQSVSQSVSQSVRGRMLCREDNHRIQK